MARRRPLSARVVSVLRAKAKNRKNITLGQLKKVYSTWTRCLAIIWFKTKNIYGWLVNGKS
jgi:hypothetical protein